MQYQSFAATEQTARALSGCTDLMRYLKCATLARTEAIAPVIDRFLHTYPDALHAKRFEEYRTKAAVAIGTTTDPAWAGPLAVAPLVEPLRLAVQASSLLARISGLRQVPFLAPVPRQTASASFAWVGQNAMKPVTKLSYDDVALGPTKLATIVILALELVKLQGATAEAAMRDALITAAVGFMDDQFINPAVTAIPNLRPASITNGVPATPSTGDLGSDVVAVVRALKASRPGAARPTLIMSGAAHIELAMATGLPDNVAIVTSPAAGDNIIALDAAAVVYADGDFAINVTFEAAVQMDSAPPTTPDAASVLISLWQHNLAGYRVERQVNWSATPGSVAYVTHVPEVTS